jgi:hypothetical protein
VFDIQIERKIGTDGGVKNGTDGDGFEFYRRCMNRRSTILKIGGSKLDDLYRFVGLGVGLEEGIGNVWNWIRLRAGR